MNNYLDTIFDDIRSSAKHALESNDKYIVIDKIYEYLEDFSAFDFQEILERILSTIEDYPSLDYGGPGPFGTFIEEQPFSCYTPSLLASLRRKPSTQVVGWLDRSIMDEDFQNGSGTNPVSAGDFASCLVEIISNSSASAECREFSDMCLSDLRKRGLA